MIRPAYATLEDLSREPGKAELIGGKIVRSMPTGRRPNIVAGNIFVALREYCKRSRKGEAYTDNMGFTVPTLPSGRQTFAPDAAYYAGPFPDDAMRFVEGAPTLAVEVRSENDYGALAESQLAEKRADYFAAGTAVVWDIDVLNEQVNAYRAAAPESPVVFRKNDQADAVPALPGFKISVSEIFA